MGCKGSKGVKYEYNGKVVTIPSKDANTLDRWSKGASARIKVNAMKKASAEEIAFLPKPYVNKNGQLMENPKQPLFTQEAFKELYDNTKQNYIWDNTWQDISDADEEPGTKMYRGQRLKSNTKIWEGFGMIKFSDGALYQGQSQGQKFEGKGRMTHPNGDVFQGDWAQGMAHGNGTFCQLTTGSSYDGQWVEDAQQGKGVEVWNNGRFQFMGDFVDNQKTGQGTLKYDGNVYQGGFKDGEFSGPGSFYNAKTGKQQQGVFQKNKLVRGTEQMDDGSTYEGEFKNGKKHGGGKITYPDGKVFLGSFTEDQKHGLGSLFDLENQSKQREQWNRGKLMDVIKTTTSQAEFEQQLQNPGYTLTASKRPKLKSVVNAQQFTRFAKAR